MVSILCQMEYGVFTLFLMRKLKPASESAFSIGAMNSSMLFSLSEMSRLILALMELYASGSLYLSQMFSISDLMP